jgi:RNA polymerase sigma-70 factor (ECF subfamily)
LIPDANTSFELNFAQISTIFKNVRSFLRWRDTNWLNSRKLALWEHVALERSDAELVEAACRGDLASFQNLYERYYRMAVGIARSRLSDWHLAEDAAQESFAIACRRLALLKDPRRFSEWLGTICRRTAGHMARSRTNHRPIDHASVSAPQASDNKEAADRLEQALKRLPTNVREVIVLHYFSGLSYEEISQALSMTQQAVHGRLQRARRALRAEFGEDEE